MYMCFMGIPGPTRWVLGFLGRISPFLLRGSELVVSSSLHWKVTLYFVHGYFLEHTYDWVPRIDMSRGYGFHEHLLF